LQIGEKLYGLRGIEMVVELLKEYTAQLQITFMAASIVVVALRADSSSTWICMVVGSSPTRSNNVIKETGVFQTYSIAFSRFSNFHREFSNFPIAFCNVFSKINLINISFVFKKKNFFFSNYYLLKKI
jgi:hypothetical protein